MPISFADALKKAARPLHNPEPPVIQPKKEHAAHNQPSEKATKQHDISTQNKQRQRTRHDNKRPPSLQQNGSNKDKKPKKPKPSSGIQLGDVLKLSKRQSNQKVPTLLSKLQAPLNLTQDFPSLGASSGTPVASTWGKAVVVKSKAPLTKPASKKVERNASTKFQKDETAKKISSPEAASSLMATFGAKQRSIEETNLMGTFLKDPKAVKKGRQRLGPRKKKFSTLKKKVLQERLEQWKMRNPNSGSCTGDNNAPSASTVALWSYCVPDEIEDEDEVEEIMLNLHEMGSKVGDLKDLYLDKENGHAFCLFATAALASAAQACWNGVVVGGERLDAELVPSLPMDGSWKTAIEAYRKKENQEEHNTTAIVILQNILTQDDLEDEDCLQESLQDIRRIAADLGSLVDVQLVGHDQIELTYTGAQKALLYFDGRVIGGQVVAARRKDDNISFVRLTNVLTEDDFEDEDCLQETLSDLKRFANQYGVVKELRNQESAVIIKYEGNVALVAASRLNGQVIGGQAIQAKLLQPESRQTHTVILRNLLTEDDLEDAECLEETKSDVAELAKQFGPVSRVDVEVEPKIVKLQYKADLGVVTTAVQQLDGMIIGGQRVYASLVGVDKQREAIAMEDVQVVEVTEEVKLLTGVQPMYSGDKLIPERFADCKRAPKIPNAGIPRKYASLVNDESIKPLLIEMLGELIRLQKRAIEDKNTKAKRRLVMGLREVARGIRSHKVKIVIMANNLDQYGAIDEKLQEIIDLSREESVPIFYEFNKRGLGKAIGKNIKIGIVGVQNAEGAHQQFKKLLSLANTHNIY